MTTTDRLIALLRERHDAGLKNYGVTVDRKDLTPEQWAQHAIEEMLDGAAYLMRLKDDIARLQDLIKRLEVELDDNGRVLQRLQDDRDKANERVERMEKAKEAKP